MLKNFANRVKETTTATDTSAIVLAGAITAFRSFASGLAVGTTRIECEVGPDSAGAWLIGEYTLTDATHLTRTAIIDSSAGGADVTLAAGSKEVFNTISATRLATVVASLDIAFSTTVPLTNGGEAYMPQQSVASVLAFSIGAAPVKNSRVYVRLVADGTNAPTFSGIKEWGGSMGYDNRNGIVNEAQFFYDGYDYWYSFSQAVGATAVDATPPTANSAAVANATPTIVTITHSEALDPGYVPPASAYTVGGHPVSSVAVSGSSTNLTCSAAFVYGEAARTVAYAQSGTNNARDLAGNLLANFSGLAITNSVGAVATGLTMAGPTTGNTSAASTNFTIGVTPVGGSITGGSAVVTPASNVAGDTFTPASVTVTNAAPTATFVLNAGATTGARTISASGGGLTAPATITYTASAAVVYIRFNPKDALLSESGTGPYTYTPTGGADYNSGRGIATQSLPASTDGSFAVTLAGAFGCVMGVQTTNTLITYSALPYYVYNFGGAGNAYALSSGSTGGTSTTGAAGDILRLRRTGATLTAEVARAATPTTWITLGNWTIGASQYYFQVGSGNASYTTLTGVGLT